MLLIRPKYEVYIYNKENKSKHQQKLHIEGKT
jgi:hypothetical protein